MACYCCCSFINYFSLWFLFVVDSLYWEGLIEDSRLLKLIESSLIGREASPGRKPNPCKPSILVMSFPRASIILFWSSNSLDVECFPPPGLLPGLICISFSFFMISYSFSISVYFLSSFSLSSAISRSIILGSNSLYIMLWLLMLWMVLSTSFILIDYEYIKRLFVDVSETWWSAPINYIWLWLPLSLDLSDWAG